MEQLDRDMQKRVWQRVQGHEEPGMPNLKRDNLKPWIMAAQENVASYRNLQLQLIGKQWEPLRKLELETVRCIYCLRGLCALRGETVKLQSITHGKEQPRRSLEKCYFRQRKLWEEAEKRTNDPENGILFRKVAERAGEHCVLLAELIGRLD